MKSDDASGGFNTFNQIPPAHLTHISINLEYQKTSRAGTKQNQKLPEQHKTSLDEHTAQAAV